MSPEELRTISSEWNGRITYRKESTAKPYEVERAVAEGGRCNNYVAAKAASLAGKGYNTNDMQVGMGIGPNGEAHSVLLVGDNHMVLDNMTDEVKPLAERQDLDIRDIVPVSAFKWF